MAVITKRKNNLKSKSSMKTKRSSKSKSNSKTRKQFKNIRKNGMGTRKMMGGAVGKRGERPGAFRGKPSSQLQKSPPSSQFQKSPLSSQSQESPLAEKLAEMQKTLPKNANTIHKEEITKQVENTLSKLTPGTRKKLNGVKFAPN